jgi:hypothetical protein
MRCLKHGPCRFDAREHLRVRGLEAHQVARRKLAYQEGPSLGKLYNLLIRQESSVMQRFLDVFWLQIWV